MAIQPSVSRRGFLWTGGAVVVRFALRSALPDSVSGQTRAGASPGGDKLPDPKFVDSFLAIHSDGSVTLFTSRVDVGTGLAIAMSQMAAEELGIPVDRIKFVSGDTAVTPDHGGTGGSTGIPQGAVAVRQAAATLHQHLLILGSEQLKRPAAELVLLNGEVRPAGGGTGVGIGTLAGDKRLMLAVDPKAALKNPSTYAIVGKPVPRPDIPGKCTGEHPYLQNFRVPGMLHARVIRPTAIGAKLLSVEESSLRGIPDTQVVRVENFLAVVAKDEWAAVRASKALKASWSDWQGLPGSEGLDRYVRESAVDHDQVIVTKGDTAAAISSAAKQFSASYSWPFQSHASLGPSCAVADVKAEGATVWTASQGPHGLRNNFAKVFGIPAEKLRVVYMDGSGSYGTNGGDDAAADAFLISKTLGKPVRVLWSREDEHAWDPKGPAQLLELRGGLDAAGNIVAWETQMYNPKNVQGNRALLAADAAGLAQGHGQATNSMTQNTDPPYAVPNIHVVTHWLKETPLRLSNLRAPGKIANVFAVESFMDELAAAAGADPLQFRMKGLNDQRAMDVLKRMAEMIGWQTRPSPNPERSQGALAIGRGMAYNRYKQAENYVAMAMEVAVERATGRVMVRRVACAHDLGLVVNPDGLRNQIEGSILQTLGRALHEEVKFDRSHVTSVDWKSYPILTFPEVPKIEVALIDRPSLPPYGAGEAATAPVAAALANAIFDATVIRLRTAPFTLERVRAAFGATAARA
jgi:CO/xanthine dehydrogenase Mo-binding subunit